MSSLKLGTEFKIPKGQSTYTGRIAKVVGFADGRAILELRNSERLYVITATAERWINEAAGVFTAPLAAVYRIEHKGDGVGCYQRGAENKEQGMMTVAGTTMADRDRHPAMYQDSKLWASLKEKGIGRFEIDFGAIEAYHFGFNTIEQLRSWMYRDEWLIGLAEQNYILAICHVPVDEVISGNSQCMFIRPREYEKHNIREYFKI